MSNNIRRGFVLVISSPSGAGKTTICKKVIEEVDGIDLSVSVTTRQKRKDEINGKDYFFRSDEEFRILEKNLSILISSELKKITRKQIFVKSYLQKHARQLIFLKPDP